MTLVAAGYWHTTYWAESYWQQDYWLEYGAYAPPVTVGGVHGRRITRQKRKPVFLIELASLLKNYLEAKLGETHD